MYIRTKRAGGDGSTPMPQVYIENIVIPQRFGSGWLEWDRLPAHKQRLILELLNIEATA